MPKNSFRRTSAVSRNPPGPSGLRLLPALPHIRRPHGLNEGPDVVVGPVGRVYAPSGIYGQIPGDFPLPGHIPDPQVHSHVEEEVVDEDEDEDESMVDTEASLKAKRLWQRWSEEVIPDLLKPYLQLLRKTGGLRVMDKVHNRAGCKGCANGRLINISCVFFESML